MTTEIALIEFINARPDGNMLRDIAIRTLNDLRNRELKSNRWNTLNTDSIIDRKKIKMVRILPSIKYKKIKCCGHNYKCLNG